MTVQSSSVSSGKRGRWGKRFLLGGVGLLILLVAAYFVVTSPAFFKGVILPRVGKSIHADVTIADASISPFSSVVLRQLKVQTTGSVPLLEGEEVRLRYNLWSILRGNIKVDEVTISSPVVNLVQNADGTSNADPLMNAGQPATPSTSKDQKPPSIDLRNFALKNGAVRVTRNLAGGGRELMELANINLALDHLANATSGKLTFGADLKLDRQTNGTLQSKLAGAFDFAFDANLHPQTAKGNARLEVVSATGPLAELGTLAGVFECELTPTELKQIALRFEKGGQQLGLAKISGPFDTARQEGNLKLEITSIDRNVLNLIGAPKGIDFGGTTINSTGQITITKNASQVAVNGQANISRFSVTQAGGTTPTIDLTLAYNVAVNQTDQTARLETFTVTGTQGAQPLLSVLLTRPTTIAWGKTDGVGEAALEMKVTDFNLRDWRAVLGDSVSAGRLQLVLNLVSQQGGKQLKLEADAQIDDLAMKMGGRPFDQGRLTAQARGQVDGFEKVNLSEYKLNLTRGQQPALSLAGSATYDGAAFAVRSRTELVPLTLTGSGPASAIVADLQVGGAFQNQVLDLKTLLVALSPTKLAPKNELHALGKLDLTNPKITKGRLSLTTEAFDVTPLYDTFAGLKQPAATSASPAPAKAPGAPAPNVEPEAMNLPFDLTLEATLGMLFLREIVVSNFTATTRVVDNHVLLDPFKGSLNGAPLNAKADINVGVKGYAYEVSFVADKLSLEPIANSFSPEYRGQYQGVILANAQVKGAGVTGASLKNTLNGQIGIQLTNANIQIVGPKTKSMLSSIATILRVEEITKLPLSWVDSQVEFGGGKIAVKQFATQSEAFEARAQGAIPIADVLNQSPLDLPVNFSLRRSLAQKSNLLPANSPTNAMYVELPKFVAVTGTLGDPKTRTDKAMLTGLLVKSGIGIAENLGVKLDGKSGDALKGIGNLLTGQGSSNTNTNKAGDTNKPAPVNPLDLFKKPKK